MKTITKVLVAFLIIAGFTQCTPVDVSPSAGNGKKVSFTLRANGGAKATKTDITQNGNSLDVTWSAGDVIYVAGSEDGYLGCLTLKTGAGTNIAVFEGEINAISKTQNIHFYYLGKTTTEHPQKQIVTGAESTTIDFCYGDPCFITGTLDFIEEFQHIASATISNVEPNHNYDVNATFVSNIAILKLDISNLQTLNLPPPQTSPKFFGTKVYKTLNINLKNGTLSGDQSASNYNNGILVIQNIFNPGQGKNDYYKNYYIAMLPGEDVSMYFFDNGNNMLCIENTNLQANTFYSNNGNAIVPKEKAMTPPGTLNGLFTVAEGEQVYFSKGNLQYQSYSLRFAEHQYDYIGNAAGNTTAVAGRPNQAEWIDLFGWGTSGNDNNNRFFQPWETNTTTSITNGIDVSFTPSSANGYGYGPTDGTNYNIDLTGQFDWGNNYISDGGGFGLWRTLSADEWQHLLTGRTDASVKRGLACVNGVNGLVILPESWELPVAGSFTPNVDNYTTNIYTVDQWSSMEENGAAFLPAAGCREDLTIADYNSIGYYWTCTHSSSGQAKVFSFQSSTNNNVQDRDRYYGCSVRLVRDL